MKTEKKRLGVRCRMILNRYELKQAVREGLHVLPDVPRGPLKFPADPPRGQPADVKVTANQLETVCRLWMRKHHDDTAPIGASFRVNQDPEGGPPESATFQWWEQPED